MHIGGLGQLLIGGSNCAILLIGNDLVKIVRSKETRRYFSQQTKTQVEIGLQIAEFAKEDMKKGTSPDKALTTLIDQLLKRDEGWKEFYTENMDSMLSPERANRILHIFESEKAADKIYQAGSYEEAANIIQSLIDSYISSDEEKGWYLQEMARYIYPLSRSESNRYQVIAQQKNIYLFKPREGMTITKLLSISLKRVENAIAWIQEFENYEELKITIDTIISHLRFGVESERFEKAFDDLAKALGFKSQRPDKEWNEGPDNLWKIKDNQYLLVECKSKTLVSRKEIYKEETGQMNNACAWFTKNYGDVPVKRIMIIPTKKIAHAAGFNLDVQIMREKNLKKLVENVNKYFMEYKNLDLKDVSPKRVQELLSIHRLTAEDILSLYSESPQ